MIRKLALIALPLLVVLAGPAAAQESQAVDSAVMKIYAGYHADENYDASAALGSTYSAATHALILEWQHKVDPNGELVDELADFDWMCECQDWDADQFKLTIEPHGEPQADRIEVKLKLDVGDGEGRVTRLEMVKENGLWLVDDQFSQSFPQGLVAALKTAIAHPARK